MPSLFAECTDMCGWVAACVCVLSFGSFGVPIKQCKQDLFIHPLVLQSYKTAVCFTTCWCVVMAGVDVAWTNWGLLSGFFWVPGATCGIYGIRNAGLAVAVGTWSAIIVLTSFFFGFVLFREPIHDAGQVCLAFLCITAGLIGMSKYSAPQGNSSSNVASYRGKHTEPSSPVTSSKPTLDKWDSFSGLEMEPLTASSSHINNASFSLSQHHEDAIMKGRTTAYSNSNYSGNNDDDTKDPFQKDRIILFGGKVSLTKRQLGILAAVMNGAWGGMNLIPLHFAKEEGFAGAKYLISFATGALIVNTLLWIALVIYYYAIKRGNWSEAIECLPSWHIQQLWRPGLCAGLLHSIGNFSAILAVTYLGQGTGYSFCQMQLFVSGLWGVFYFQEIKGPKIIAKWFGSAMMAILGIVWLSFEHKGGVGH